MSKTFGEKLKEARTDRKLKQSELAKQLGVTNTTISNWEKNISKPDLDMLSYICGALNVKVSYFLEAKLPEDQISIPEFDIIKKYRDLDNHGKEMVDFTLEKEWERSISLKEKNNIVQIPVHHLEPMAAHNNSSNEEGQQELMQQDLDEL